MLSMNPLRQHTPSSSPACQKLNVHVALHNLLECGVCERSDCGRARMTTQTLQGYLAHKETPTPLGPP